MPADRKRSDAQKIWGKAVRKRKLHGRKHELYTAIDIFEQATNSDKLLSSGLYCIDELRVKLGDTALKTDWSQKHYITKNYAEAEKMEHLGDVKGGE